MADNLYGDLELTDPRAMRALAHPVRLAILERLQRNGPHTATELAPHVGATPSVTSWHLRHLAGFGLVRDSAPSADRRQRRWEAAARGFRFESPGDPGDVEGRTAAAALSRQMFHSARDLPDRWLAEVQPHLEPEWLRAAGFANTGVTVTVEELQHIDAEIEALLAPYVTRGEAPDGARRVRMLRYLLPERAAQ